jgi:tetratricopeptide (TPR) repeat protein
MSRPSLSDRVNEVFRQEDWAGARKLLTRALKRHPKDHWLLTRLGTTYYEERDYRKALELSEEARKLAPGCPLVLWDLAGALDMLDDRRAAVKVYEDLLRKGPRAIAEDECGEGLAWAHSLLTDCLYRVGVCYQELGEDDKARHYLLKFLEVCLLGAKSMYDVEDARRRIREIVQPGSKATGSKEDQALVEQQLEEVRQTLLSA